MLDYYIIFSHICQLFVINERIISLFVSYCMQLLPTYDVKNIKTQWQI